MSKIRVSALAAALALVAGACGTGEGQDEAVEVVAESGTISEVTGSLQSASNDDGVTDDAPVEVVEPRVDDGSDTTESPGETQQPAETSMTGDQSRLASTVLAGAFEQATQGSARFEATFEIVSSDPAIGGDIAMSFNGAYDIANQSSYFEMDLSAMADAMGDEIPEGFGGFFDEPIKMITIGDEGWIQWGLLEMFGLETGQWLEMGPDDTSSLFSGTGMGDAGITNPADLLGQFADANAVVEDLGRETVRGVETQHHRAYVDLAELSQTLPADEQAELAESLGGVEGLGTVPMDFWIGDDGLLYRFSISLDTSQLPDSEGLESVSINFEMYDYGTDVGITAPDPSLVVAGDSLGLS